MSSRAWILLLLLLALAGPARGDEPGLTEAEAVRQALAGSPTLRAAILGVASAEAAVAGEEGRYAPRLGAAASLGHIVTQALGAAGVASTTIDAAEASATLSRHLVWGTDLSLSAGASLQGTDSAVGSFGPGAGLSLRLGVAQPLLAGAGRDVGEAALRAASVGRDQSRAARDQAASALLRDVVTAYWELWYAAAAVDIEQRSLALSTDELSAARARIAAGALAPTGSLPFETGRATAEERLVAATTTVVARRLGLGRLLGDSGLAGVPSEDAPPLPAPPPADALERALAASPEIASLQAAVALARLAERTAGDELRPRLDLEGYVQLQGLGDQSLVDAGLGLVTGDAASVHLGVSYSAALDDRQRRAAVARAHLAVATAEAELEAARLGVAASVASALADDAATRRQLALAGDTAAAARRQLEAEQRRFASGDGTPLDVLQAEEQVRAAELRAVRARVDLVTNRAALDDATGELLARWAR